MKRSDAQYIDQFLRMTDALRRATVKARRHQRSRLVPPDAGAPRHIWFAVMDKHLRGESAPLKEVVAAVAPHYCSEREAQRTVKELAALGWYEVKNDPGDRRRSLVEPTRKCIELFDEYIERMETYKFILKYCVIPPQLILAACGSV